MREPYRDLVVARATAPAYPEQLVAVFEGKRRSVFLFSSRSERDAFIAELVAEGANAVESTLGLTDSEAERAA